MNSIVNIRLEGKMNALGLFLIVLCSSLGVAESGQTGEMSAEEIIAKQDLRWDLENPLNTDSFVSLRRKQTNDSHYGAGHVCGGSLISHNVVLTAAHCFVDRTSLNGTFLDKSNFIVVLGKKQLLMPNDKPLTFGVDEVAVLVTMFNMKSYDKDIALIHLNGTVPPFIRPVQMTTVTAQPLTHCQISAWNNDQMEYFLGNLVKLNVTLIEQPACQQVDLQPGMICAENTNDTKLAACTADGGGPLLCQGQLVGIGSWGIRCGVPNQSGIYTSVHHYKAWIDEFVKRYDIREQRQAVEAEADSDAEDREDLDSDRDDTDEDFDGPDSKDLTDAIDATKAVGGAKAFKPSNMHLYSIFLFTIYRF